MIWTLIWLHQNGTEHRDKVWLWWRIRKFEYLGTNRKVSFDARDSKISAIRGEINGAIDTERFENKIRLFFSVELNPYSKYILFVFRINVISSISSWNFHVFIIDRSKISSLNVKWFWTLFNVQKFLFYFQINQSIKKSWLPNRNFSSCENFPFFFSLFIFAKYFSHSSMQCIDSARNEPISKGETTMKFL